MKRIKDMRTGQKFKIFPRGKTIYKITSKYGGEIFYKSLSSGRSFIADRLAKGILVK